MKEVRQIQYRLLCDADSICKEKQLPYILSRHTARAAVLNQALPCRVSVPTVAMRYADALRLAAEMEKLGYGWESSFKNRNIPGCTLRIFRPGTFYFRADAIGRYRNDCVGMDVELVRSVPCKGLVAKACIALEAACVMASDMRNQSTGWRIALCVLRPLEKLLLGAMYKKGDGKTLRISRFPKKSISFPASLMQETENTPMKDHAFPVPAAFDRYMDIEFNEKWKAAAAPEEEDMHLVMMGGEDERDDMVQALSRIKMEKPPIRWVRWYVLRGRMRYMRREIEKNWHLLFLTRDRFSMARQYMPKKERLLELYRQGERDVLGQEMAPYLEAVGRNWKNGLVLCFDRELMDVALQLLEESGKEKYAAQLRDHVFPQHLKPMKFEGYEHE